MAFNTWWLPTYLAKWLTLCTVLGMTIKQNHTLKRWGGKFSTMPIGISSRKFSNYHCLPLHDHFGEFLMGFSHSTKSKS
jgi:hypothetical protein